MTKDIEKMKRLLFIPLLVAVLLSCVSGVLPIHASAAIATNSTTITSKATAACAVNDGFGVSDYSAYAKTEQGKACIGAFTDYYKSPSSTASPTYCHDNYFSQQAKCSEGLTLGANVRAQDAKSGGSSSSTNTTDSQLAKQANTSQTCGNGDSSCIAGYIAGYKGTPSENTACKSGNSVSGYKVTSTSKCKTGYAGGTKDKTPTSPTSGTQAAVTAASGGASGSDSSGSSGDTTPTCESSGFSLGWILCSVFNWISDGAHWIFSSIVQPFLVTTPISTDPSDASYQIWSNFRIYGDIFLIIALLVIVFGQAIGGGLVDAYTAKKVLPRLLAAAILINLSIYIVAFLVDFTNILGKGMSDILTAPLTHCGGTAGNCWDFRLSNTDIVSVFGVGLVGFLATSTAFVGFISALFFGGGFIGAAGAAFTAAFFVGLPIIFAAIGVFVTLIFRKGLILFLVLVSPVAFALYCLPNTERYFKKWWDLLIEALMVYPIVIAIFGVADILSVTLLNANNISPSSLTSHVDLDVSRTLALVVAFLLQFIPLLLIPFAFRFASGALRRIYDAATTAGAKVNDLTKNRTEQAKADYRAQHYAGRARAYHNARAFGERHQGPLGIGRTASRWAGRRAGGYNIEALMSAERANTAKQMNDQIATGRDEEIRGLTVNKQWALSQGQEGVDWRTNSDGIREFKSLGGAWVSEQDVDAGHSRWGGNQYAQQAALSYESRKALTEEDINRMGTNYGTVATAPGGWGMSASEARGAWIGSAFENQNQHLEHKYTDAMSGRLSNASGFVDEVYEKRGSYPMAQMSSHTIESLKEAHQQAVSSGDVDQQEKIAAIAETFMHEVGVGGGVRGQVGDETPLIEPDGTAATGRRQASTAGAAHVAERVRELAELTGVYGAGPIGPYTDPGHAPTPNQREQK
jgi:hypothetical protein